MITAAKERCYRETTKEERREGGKCTLSESTSRIRGVAGSPRVRCGDGGQVG